MTGSLTMDQISYKDLSIEVSLHEPHLTQLREAWLQLYEINSSLNEQHEGLFLLWTYITQKLQHQARKWYYQGKKLLKSADFTVDQKILDAWSHELICQLTKAAGVIELLDGENTSSQETVSALYQVSIPNTLNFYKNFEFLPVSK